MTGAGSGRNAWNMGHMLRVWMASADWRGLTVQGPQSLQKENRMDRNFTLLLGCSLCTSSLWNLKIFLEKDVLEVNVFFRRR